MARNKVITLKITIFAPASLSKHLSNTWDKQKRLITKTVHDMKEKYEDPRIEEYILVAEQCIASSPNGKDVDDDDIERPTGW